MRKVKRTPVLCDELLVSKSANTSLSLMADSGRYVRNLAKIIYVTSPDNISITDIWNMGDPYNSVHINTLHRWSQEDEWVKGREDYRRNLEQKILTKLSKSHAKAIADQLTNLDSVADQLYDTINRGFVLPKSLEGIVNALVRLEEFRFNARIGIKDSLDDIIPGALNNIEQLDLDKDTLHEMAIALIKIKQGNNG